MNKFKYSFLLLMLSLQVFAQKDQHRSLNFFVLGDWGMKGQEQQTEVANQMRNEAKTSDLSFLLTTGDNFYEKGVLSTTDEHWTLSYENVYQELTRQFNWYAALGNHDYMGSPEAETAYHKVNPNWNLPSRYYTFVKETPDKQKVRFVVLDTNPYATAYYKDPKYAEYVKTQDTTRQTHWVDSVLAVSSEPWKIVVGHHPIYSSKPKPGETEFLRSSIAPLLEKYKVQAYFSGHDHLMQFNKPENTSVSYIISGGAGKPRNSATKETFTVYSENKAAFASCSIQGKTLKITFIDAQGQHLFDHKIHR
ncbi:Calcineurin-like phosphoesterase [Pseudarcicella hirudinis]|uniref:acid phosphatase n=1 Tax=Pseudarcicella hirudinis TaxID=1079859 RepID=A0A1I5UQD4_9BACT|nr:metallophosphoesterase [Pseudarcicella hirudinis]SFP97514.1 Calcineurin-like phosphoesterase [Pseudarcicella hirudinis]